jgi:hypothetical protein
MMPNCPLLMCPAIAAMSAARARALRGDVADTAGARCTGFLFATRLRVEEVVFFLLF